MKRLAMTSLLSAALLLPALGTPAFAEEQTSGTTDDPIVARAEQELNCAQGEHRLVTDSHGFRHAIGCLELDRQAPPNSQNVAGPTVILGHWSPYEDHTFRCGSSTIRNQQIAWYHYRGTVHASGEFGSGEDCGGAGRVVSASITYSRGGKQLGKAVANVGETKSTHAWDSPNPFAAKTQVNYNFTLE